MSLRPQAPVRRSRSRRDSGLATLEWLLVVSVSALLAALVIAHVQRNVDRAVHVVGDSSDAGLVAPDSLASAQSLADELAHQVQVASLQYEPSDYRFQDPSFWEDHFSTRCRRIREVFSDIEAEGVQVTVETDFRLSGRAGGAQQIVPRDLGEIPWIFGAGGFDFRLAGDEEPASTVCQVLLSH